MSDIKERLKQATDTCVSSYETWEKDKKNTQVRETLMEAVHELRKAAARLEIELAISERDQMASKPLPIPPHRSSRRKGAPQEDQGDDNFQESNRKPRSSSGGGGGRGRRRTSSGGNDGNS